mmetsp:Transcript_148096/g.475571  ORF Transcript_148096/g.475571 Transcript_148096/m.475571 type:complete len:280 (-) Transcript_148096:721-1560(-)
MPTRSGGSSGSARTRGSHRPRRGPLHERCARRPLRWRPSPQPCCPFAATHSCTPRAATPPDRFPHRTATLSLARRWPDDDVRHVVVIPNTNLNFVVGNLLGHHGALEHDLHKGPVARLTLGAIFEGQVRKRLGTPSLHTMCDHTRHPRIPVHQNFQGIQRLLRFESELEGVGRLKNTLGNREQRIMLNRGLAALVLHILVGRLRAVRLTLARSGDLFSRHDAPLQLDNLGGGPPHGDLRVILGLRDFVERGRLDAELLGDTTAAAVVQASERRQPRGGT